MSDQQWEDAIAARNKALFRRLGLPEQNPDIHDIHIVITVLLDRIEALEREMATLREIKFTATIGAGEKNKS